MASQEPAIDPKNQDSILKNPTVQPVIEDRRGPMVFDLTQVASLNGIDPNYSKKDGV